MWNWNKSYSLMSNKQCPWENRSFLLNCLLWNSNYSTRSFQSLRKRKSLFGRVSLSSLKVKGAHRCRPAIGGYIVTGAQGVHMNADHRQITPSLQQAAWIASSYAFLLSEFNVAHFFYLTFKTDPCCVQLETTENNRSAVQCPTSGLLQVPEHTTHFWWEWGKSFLEHA